MEIELARDAMSVFAATTANHVKMPAEKFLLSHIQFLRELCDKYIVTCLTWCDTRDMLADGLTKGKCERDSVATAMAGSFTMKHEVKSWTAPQAVYSEAALFCMSTEPHQDRLVALGCNGLTLAGDGPTLEQQKSSFCEAWPYISSWIAQHRRALMDYVALAWVDEAHEHLTRKCLFAMYNWRRH